MKVLYLCEVLSSYRIPILKRVASNIDLVVVCGEAQIERVDLLNFEVVRVNINNVGPFLRYDINNFEGFCSQFDVVIGLMNIRFYQLMKICIARRSFKLALWGIGTTGSYTKPFGSWSFATKLRTHLCKRADALIFYSEYPLQMFKSAGFNEEKMYVAHNTVDNVTDVDFEKPRDTVLFIGTLYRAKGLEALLQKYLESYETFGDKIPKLIIIGSGELREELEEFVILNELVGQVEFTGPIYDNDTLKKYFEKALFSVSPNQAGLSVLTSMSYGVPFVTCSDAITGGEILNITNGYNGIIMKDINELIDVFQKSTVNRDYFIKMGKCAFEYYRLNRNPDVMANAIIKCIEEI